MSNEEIVKAAVARMCEYLGERNVKVKRTMMYEAVSEGFGLDSWRELKAVIDAPRAKPVKRLPALGEWQAWSVDAIYSDNDQQYGEYYQGRTPLEAAVNCQIERLTDFGNEVNIVSVSDMAEKCRLSYSIITELQPSANDTALRALARAAAAVKETVRLLPRNSFALCWLTDELLDGKLEDPPENPFEFGPDTFDFMTDSFKLEDLAKDEPVDYVVPTDADTATSLLVCLCDMVEQAHGGVVKLEAKDEELAARLYQVRAMCKYFGAIYDDPEEGICPAARELTE